MNFLSALKIYAQPRVLGMLALGFSAGLPPQPLRAHQALDQAVDLVYGKKSFVSEAERVAFLLDRYRALTSLLPGSGAASSRQKRS
jgi:hypothetical protein